MEDEGQKNKGCVLSLKFFQYMSSINLGYLL